MAVYVVVLVAPHRPVVGVLRALVETCRHRVGVGHDGGGAVLVASDAQAKEWRVALSESSGSWSGRSHLGCRFREWCCRKPRLARDRRHPCRCSCPAWPLCLRARSGKVEFRTLTHQIGFASGRPGRIAEATGGSDPECPDSQLRAIQVAIGWAIGLLRRGNRWYPGPALRIRGHRCSTR